MRKCAICGKSSIIRGKRRLLRGHYNPVSKSRKYPNLQWARLPSPAWPLVPPPALLSKAKRAGRSGRRMAQAHGGQAKAQGVRKRICTNCLKTLHKKILS